MLRLNRGLSLESFSDVIEKRFLSSVEQGKASPSLRSLIGIAGVLQLSVCNLLRVAQAAATEVDPLVLHSQDQQVLEQLIADQLIQRPVPDLQSLEKGLKGKRGKELRAQVRDCQERGLTKADTTRLLKIGRSTVNRHWAESE